MIINTRSSWTGNRSGDMCCSMIPRHTGRYLPDCRRPGSSTNCRASTDPYATVAHHGPGRSAKTATRDGPRRRREAAASGRAAGGGTELAPRVGRGAAWRGTATVRGAVPIPSLLPVMLQDLVDGRGIGLVGPHRPAPPSATPPGFLIPGRADGIPRRHRLVAGPDAAVGDLALADDRWGGQSSSWDFLVLLLLMFLPLLLLLL